MKKTIVLNWHPTNQRIRKTDCTYEVLIYKPSFELPIVPQRFISVVWALTTPPFTFCLSHLFFTFSSAFLYLPPPPLSCDTEHKLKHTACLRDEWICGGEKGGVDGEVEEEKVTVFPESKPPVFDHEEWWCWSLRCVSSLTSHGRLAGWTWWGFGVFGAEDGSHTRCYTG